ncbi:hypothetical protein DFJ58DRAFT_733772 [Suillus subalutaceus]|uniref:uncharacterized protein n=1 Tax=Suillus subalutaceus TaxID=48586 RepID=UPI001B868473|nr:uncharacterized protein DFJ58DRAFT_733772 [Suillus subalutaceus]KAG1838520.1 hypothetical protein DFJ58DRAFT_733772 [Suillus subalutaceus]
MTTSSKPAKENWYLSNLLAYDTLPNHHDCHCDLILSHAKFTADTRTDFYDRSMTTRRYALVGVACSSIFSCSCIIAGIVTLANHGVLGVAVVNPEKWAQFPLQGDILAMTLYLIVTLCTESISFIHGISLRSALASESRFRFRFDTNLRPLTAARVWYNPNGALLNSVSAVLIISYSSASLLVCLDCQITPQTFWEGIAIAGLPLLFLGVALLFQVMIALSGIWAAKILTWSSSPFDLTTALVHHVQLTPAAFRCMCCDLDMDGGLARPPEIWSFA